jgi:hypothetical protein
MRTLSCLLVMVLASLCHAQKNCATLEHWEGQKKKIPLVEQIRRDIERHCTQHQKTAELRGFNPIVIPTVVNVIYNNATQNISDEQIISQLAVLNEDFGRRNVDADNNWPQASETGISFKLANIDPQGLPCTGIRRQSSPKNQFIAETDEMKSSATGGLNAWPTDKYLNIWVCNLEGELMGYGQYPGGDKNTDGVVVDFQYFGTKGSAKAPFNLGRTATHEVGHWLNLFHIWGDGDCSIDDFVGDTPDSDNANHGCPREAFGCGGKLMFQNFMDYTDDACMNLFTEGQAKRMRALFAPGGFRESIVTSPGYQTVSSTPKSTCADGIKNGDETGLDCGGACVPCAKCPVPAKSEYSHAGAKVALNWAEVRGVNTYFAEVRQLKPSISRWTGVLTNSNQAMISGVRIGRTYEYRVRSICGVGDSSLTIGEQFVTRSSNRLELNTSLPNSAKIYPNPAHDFVYLRTGRTEPQFEPLTVTTIAQEKEPTVQVIQIKIMDLHGRLIRTVSTESSSLGIEMNIEDLRPGVYLLTQYAANGQPLHAPEKLVKY